MTAVGQQQQQLEQQHYLHTQAHAADPNITEWSNPIHVDTQQSISSPVQSTVAPQQQELTHDRDGGLSDPEHRWATLRAASHWAATGQQASEQHNYSQQQHDAHQYQ